MESGSKKFKKKERLCSKKIISLLINEGDSVYLPLFKVIYLKNPPGIPSPVQVAFSVSKKGFRNAVTRNLLKRRMREAYRKNKYILYDSLQQAGMCLAFILIYRQNLIATYPQIEKAIIETIQKLAIVAVKNNK
jgi:ribonuclease P protein component